MHNNFKIELQISVDNMINSDKCFKFMPKEPTNMLDIKAILWLENYLLVII